jgi:pheromone shutdown protein TraB
MTEIQDLDYNERVQLVGTAHFTRRSMNDAYEAIKSSRPKDVALELDMRRYLNLNAHCVG